MRFVQREYKTRSTARRHIITVKRFKNKNESGFTAVEGETVGSYWASVEPVSEQARVMYQSMSVKASHVITLDGRIDVREDTDAIIFGDRKFEILTIKKVGEMDRDQIIITQEIRAGQGSES